MLCLAVEGENALGTSERQKRRKKEKRGFHTIRAELRADGAAFVIDESDVCLAPIPKDKLASMCCHSADGITVIKNSVSRFLFFFFFFFFFSQLKMIVKSLWVSVSLGVRPNLSVFSQSE